MTSEVRGEVGQSVGMGPRAALPHAALHYAVSVHSTQAHLFAVTLRIERPAPDQEVSLPVWIAGSYLVREFAQHLQGLRVMQNGHDVPLRQLDKHRWQIAAVHTQALELHYAVYAFDSSVRAAFLDSTRGFFNPTSLCLQVKGQEDQTHTIELIRPPETAHWQAVSALAPLAVDDDGFGCYGAKNYDELADSPVTLGPLWSACFNVAGVVHRVVITGAGAWLDGERLVQDMRRICHAQIAFWHGQGSPPFERYIFMLHASASDYGGLEHRCCTALICPRADLPCQRAIDPLGGCAPRSDLGPNDGYTGLLKLVSHEYFHAWCVKRLRPAEFAHYDYARENYTELLWFFEGFTSYYDLLFLRRSALIDDHTYLQLLAKTINQVEQTPGRHVQSVAQASFDAWVKYYRVHENTPNATVSYYSKGALVALCLDLTLRSEGRTTLDAVMRALWLSCPGGLFTEAHLLRVMEHLGQRSLAAELAQWVHATGDLPAAALLQDHGVKVQLEPAPVAQQLGLRVSQSHGIVIKTVLHASAAQRAGMAAGDEWMGIELPPMQAGGPAEAWRIHKLEELPQLLGARTHLVALISRDKQLLRCPLDWPLVPRHLTRLSAAHAAPLRAWLDSKPVHTNHRHNGEQCAR